MDYDQFILHNKAVWENTLTSLFPDGIPQSATWKDFDSIFRVLSALAQENLCHMFYPSSGGMHLDSVEKHTEEGCLLLDGHNDVVKPRILTFNSFQDDLQWAYFRLEANRLLPHSTGYGKEYSSDYREILVELEPGTYERYSVWEEGRLYDDSPLPKTARPIKRWFSGTFLFFRVTSFYNSEINEYDGAHNKLSEQEFRVLIERYIRKLPK